MLTLFSARARERGNPARAIDSGPDGLPCWKPAEYRIRFKTCHLIACDLTSCFFSTNFFFFFLRVLFGQLWISRLWMVVCFYCRLFWFWFVFAVDVVLSRTVGPSLAGDLATWCLSRIRPCAVDWTLHSKINGVVLDPLLVVRIVIIPYTVKYLVFELSCIGIWKERKKHSRNSNHLYQHQQQQPQTRRGGRAKGVAKNPYLSMSQLSFRQMVLRAPLSICTIFFPHFGVT